MAQIFISYSRSDSTLIEKLSDQLEKAGHSVWWDRHIRGGAAFAKDIEAQLKTADVVIVAWSKSANQSDWVKDEAVYGRDNGLLIPICLSDCEPPLGFRQYQIVNFNKWHGDSDADEMQQLLTAIEHISGDAAQAIEPTPAAGWQARLREPQWAALLTVAVIALIGSVFWLLPKNDREAAVTTAETVDADEAVSVAVLPFADMSPEGNQEYFADGLSEELLNVLVRIDGLKVASRTSSFALKNEVISIAEVADRLNVLYVLEGSVRKMNNRIRITAQLIDTRDDRHVWSETYDRHLADIFRIQDEIASAVVGELRDELGMGLEDVVIVETPTENMSAYDTYLLAREKFIARGARNVRESLKLFEQVVEMDEGFARGWEGLAAVYAIATSWGVLDRDYSAMSLVAAERALDLDPNLSMPYAVKGLTYRTHYPTPWAESISNLKSAIERDAKNANAWLWLGMNYMATGAAEDAVAAFNECMAIDEAQRLCRKYRSISNLFLNRQTAAMADAEFNAEQGYFSDFDVYIPTLLAADNSIAAYTVSRNIYWWGGFPHKDYVTALKEPVENPDELLAEFEEWAKGQKVDIAEYTNVMLAIGAYDKVTVETFDNDYEDLWLPHFAAYRKSDDFKALAKALGLEQYWREFGFPPQCRALSEAEYECN